MVMYSLTEEGERLIAAVLAEALEAAR